MPTTAGCSPSFATWSPDPSPHRDCFQNMARTTASSLAWLGPDTQFRWAVASLPQGDTEIADRSVGGGGPLVSDQDLA